LEEVQGAVEHHHCLNEPIDNLTLIHSKTSAAAVRTAQSAALATSDIDLPERGSDWHYDERCFHDRF
jgi:hypothetical protein